MRNNRLIIGLVVILVVMLLFGLVLQMVGGLIKGFAELALLAVGLIAIWMLIRRNRATSDRMIGHSKAQLYDQEPDVIDSPGRHNDQAKRLNSGAAHEAEISQSPQHRGKRKP